MESIAAPRSIKVIEALRTSGQIPTSVQEIDFGGNNRLFRVQLDSMPDILAKIYFKDDRNRLSREYNAFAFLRKKSFSSVPLVIFKDDKLNLACYSFEAGKVKPSAGLSTRDLDRILDFVYNLQSIPAESVDVDFPRLSLHLFQSKVMWALSMN